MGFVVNKPASARFGSIVDELGMGHEGEGPDVPVMLGGPVQPQTGWLLFDPSVADLAGAGDDDCISVTPRIALSPSVKALERVAARTGAPPARLLLGYAGWSPGQLEDEMREGSWYPIDVDADILFDTPAEDRWRVGLAHLGIDPARVAGGVVASA